MLDGLDDAFGLVVVDAFEMFHADAHAQTHEVSDGHVEFEGAVVELLLELLAHANADRSLGEGGVFAASHNGGG